MRTQRSVRLIFVIWSFDEQQQRDGGVILFVSQFSISQYLNIVPQYNPAVGMFGSTDIVVSADGLANTQQILWGRFLFFNT